MNQPTTYSIYYIITMEDTTQSQSKPFFFGAFTKKQNNDSVMAEKEMDGSAVAKHQDIATEDVTETESFSDSSSSEEAPSPPASPSTSKDDTNEEDAQVPTTVTQNNDKVEEATVNPVKKKRGSFLAMFLNSDSQIQVDAKDLLVPEFESTDKKEEESDGAGVATEAEVATDADSSVDHKTTSNNNGNAKDENIVEKDSTMGESETDTNLPKPGIFANFFGKGMSTSDDASLEDSIGDMFEPVETKAVTETEINDRSAELAAFETAVLTKLNTTDQVEANNGVAENDTIQADTPEESTRDSTATKPRRSSFLTMFFDAPAVESDETNKDRSEEEEDSVSNDEASVVNDEKCLPANDPSSVTESDDKAAEVLFSAEDSQLEMEMSCADFSKQVPAGDLDDPYLDENDATSQKETMCCSFFLR